MPLLYSFLLLAFTACNNQSAMLHLPVTAIQSLPGHNPYATIAAIPLPAGYTRVPANNKAYINWLRQLPLKEDKTVYMYNGQPKRNQGAQFAVLDIPVGNKDLQQCADAVMRLRAEYLYGQKRFSEIDFSDNNLVHYRLPAKASRQLFDQYLEKVFSFCGTASLDKQLASVSAFSAISGGQVLIKGGSPGHAMQVMDVAVNRQGQKIYLLAQSYMPAQDIHVVINPGNNDLSPWYAVNKELVIETPEWTFYQHNLKKWPAE